jgi:hypothetical protein
MVLPPQEVELRVKQFRHDRRSLYVALSWGVVFVLFSHLIWVGGLRRTFPSSYSLRKVMDGCLFLVGISASMFLYPRIPASSRMFVLYASVVVALLCLSAQFRFPT